MGELGEIKALQERMARIEKVLKEIQEHLGLESGGSAWWGGGDETSPSELSDEVLTLLHEGKEIQAIKRYRELTGLGLKEAKDAIDQAQAG